MRKEKTKIAGMLMGRDTEQLDVTRKLSLTENFEGMSSDILRQRELR